MTEKLFGHHEHEPPQPRAIDVLTKDRLTACDNSEYTATVFASPLLKRDDGSASVDGDVLSVQPDGSLQTRPAGTAGPFERAVVTTAGLVYRPKGYEGSAYLMPLANDWPNK